MREQAIDPELAHALYGKALEEGDWRPALDRLRTLLCSSEAALTVFRPEERPAVQTTGAFLTSDTCKRYIDHYGRIDPKNAYFTGASSGFVFNDARHFDDGFVSRNPFYQEFSLPLDSRHTLDLLAGAGGGRSVFLAVMRPERRGWYDEADEAFLGEASRHVLRVLAVKEKLAAAEAAARVAAGVLDRLSFGLLVLDSCGRVRLANRAAIDICGSGGGLQIRSNRLVAHSVPETCEVDAAVRQAATAGGQIRAVRIRQRDDDPLLAWIAPLPVSSPLNPGAERSVLAIVASPIQQTAVLPEHLRRLYGLTFAEAELAIMLAGGATVAEAARRRRIKCSTARTQLLSVLQKLGVHRQSDLARLVARLPGALLQPVDTGGR